MKRNRKFMPYVRRANGREKSESFRIAFRLAFYQDKGTPFYVMVHRGFPNLVMECGATKREVQQKPTGVAFGFQSFRQWARRIRKTCL